MTRLFLLFAYLTLGLMFVSVNRLKVKAPIGSGHVVSSDGGLAFVSRISK